MYTSLVPAGRVIFLESTSCKLSMIKMVTWQPVDEAPLAKVQVTVMLPLSSITVVEDWRPVVSVCMQYVAEKCEQIERFSSQFLIWSWTRQVTRLTYKVGFLQREYFLHCSLPRWQAGRPDQAPDHCSYSLLKSCFLCVLWCWQNCLYLSQWRWRCSWLQDR